MRKCMKKGMAAITAAMMAAAALTGCSVGGKDRDRCQKRR